MPTMRSNHSEANDYTFPLILEHVDDILTVTEDQIIRALRLCFERLKMVVEPSGAVSLAAVLYSDDFAQLVSRLAQAKGSEVVVGVVFSGGNIEIAKVLNAFAGV